MFASHMDEIGIVVTFIDEKGFLRFADVGGLYLRNLINRRVRFENGVIGVIGTEENNEKRQMAKMFIDIGAKSRGEAEKMVSIGDMAVFEGELSCQNGNRGFGQEIDKLVLVTCDLMCFNKNREFFQAYIDGGLFSANLINALYYEGIGSIPLSASLSTTQEKKLRGILDIKDNEVLIVFIGVGNYPEECLTARSERKPEPDIRVI